MKENICNFVPYQNDYHSLHTINYVYETNKENYNKVVSRSSYAAHFVCSGKGILHQGGRTIELGFGDVFFTFPGYPFRIEFVEDFSFMYISFLGTRGNMILEQLGISTSKFHFNDCDDIYFFWQKAINIKQEVSNLMTESILLYTFYFIGNKILVNDKEISKGNNLAYSVKKYIDDNYSDKNLSLEEISKKMLYSSKYMSSTFKRVFNITVSDYITTLRIQHACALIQLGFPSISDISRKCGFSDPQYFSKVFKKKMTVTPGEYIKNIKL